MSELDVDEMENSHCGRTRALRKPSSVPDREYLERCISDMKHTDIMASIHHKEKSPVSPRVRHCCV